MNTLKKMKLTKKQKKLFNNLASSFHELNEVLVEASDELLDSIVFEYPFAMSFDDQALQVADWVEGLTSDTKED